MTSTSEPDCNAYEQAHPVIVPAVLTSPHPITRLTAALHGWDLDPPWASAEPDWKDGFSVSLVHADRQRALLLIDTLLKACDARGFEMRHNPEGRHHGISIFVHDQAIPLQLIERGTVVTHLSLEVAKCSRRKLWKDHPRRPLEKRLHEVVRYLRGHAAARIAARREREERESQYAEMELKRAQLREEVKKERKAFDALIDEAESWQRAKSIRTYLKAVEAWAKREGRLGEYTEWLDWASDQADRLDPLSPSPPSVLDTPRDQYRKLGQYEILNDDGSIERIWG